MAYSSLAFYLLVTLSHLFVGRLMLLLSIGDLSLAIFISLLYSICAIYVFVLCYFSGDILIISDICLIFIYIF